MTEHRLPVRVLPQPTETTCGPTCLQGVYDFWGDAVPLDSVIEETGTLPDGGTLSVLLAHHALSRGYRATIYTYNVQIFDPTWFRLGRAEFMAKLRAQGAVTPEAKLREASNAYVDFIGRGGVLRFETLTEALLRSLLLRGVPILTGLSATFLHRASRELASSTLPDDVAGVPVGHFVVLAGHRPDTRELLVADPWQPHPRADASSNWVDVDRVMNAILLGIITYDANLLLVEPKDQSTSWPPPPVRMTSLG